MSTFDGESRGKGQWLAVSRNEPCPVCRKTDNCKISIDGRAIYCGRVQSSNKQNRGGQWLHFLEDSHQYENSQNGNISSRQATLKGCSPSEASGKRNFSHLAATGVKRIGKRLYELSDALGVSAESLRKIDVGILSIYGNEKLTFPERDARGKIIGITGRRVNDGIKRAINGSKRGLTYSADWYRSKGPIYLVEGATDTAALMDIGQCVVGRPSCSGGVGFLGELLRDYADREIIVVGERDYKESTGEWPGKKGAISTAKSLAEKLKRPIAWALPPEPFKDAREYLNAPDPKAAWKLETEIIYPPAPPEPYQPPTGEMRNLDEWRQELSSRRQEIVNRPGLYFDGSPTGAGKSFADIKIMAEVGSSITVVPTHGNGDDLVAELKNADLDAAKLPARASPKQEEEYLNERDKSQCNSSSWNYGVCRDIDAAEEAEEFGLQVGAVVCPSCKFREECDFLEKSKEAQEADHLIVTHHMFLNRSQEISSGRDIVFIHEDSRNLLRPLHKVEATKLNEIISVAAEAKCIEINKSGQKDLAYIDAYDLLADTARAISKQSETNEVAREFNIDKTCALPSRIQMRLHQACKALKQREGLEFGLESDAMRMMLGIMSGKIKVCITRQQSAIQGQSPSKTVVAVTHTTLPTNIPVLFADATGSSEQIKLHSGLPVKDITPTGYLRPLAERVQITSDIKKRTRISAVVRVLATELLKNQRTSKVGIIGHKKHIETLMADDSPLGVLRGRISKWTYFGEGSDRASNEWLNECKRLIVLGTPRVPPAAIEDELIRRGHLHALGEDRDWVERSWEAKTVSGKLRIVKTKGYQNRHWREAYDSMVRDSLLQAIGRGRSFQRGGIPIAVFSNETLGIAVEDESMEIKPLSQSSIKKAIWFEKQVAKNLNNTYYTFCNFTNADMVREWGLPKDNISKILKDLARIGYLRKLEIGRWGVTSLLGSEQQN